MPGGDARLDPGVGQNGVPMPRPCTCQWLVCPSSTVPAGAVAAAGPARGGAGEELAAHRAPGSTQACIQLLQSPCLSEGISGAVAGPLPAAVFTLADAVHGWCRWQTLQLPVHTTAAGGSLTRWCQVLCVPSFPGAGIVVLPQHVCGVQSALRAVESWAVRYQGTTIT